MLRPSVISVSKRSIKLPVLNVRFNSNYSKIPVNKRSTSSFQKSYYSSPATNNVTINRPNSSSNTKNNSNQEANSSSSSKTVKSFGDSPAITTSLEPGAPINWSDSFHGLGTAPFPKEVSDILMAPINNDDIEIKPDGLLYLPEIKYRRILNRAFGPGGWGLAPRTESLITEKQISREYALVCHGRLVSVARGEQDYFGGDEKITTALEGCKSNALMRCCKDLGIASELWDPSFIRKWKKEFCDEIFAEHVTTKKKKKLWKLKKNKTLDYPYKKV